MILLAATRDEQCSDDWKGNEADIHGDHERCEYDDDMQMRSAPFPRAGALKRAALTDLVAKEAPHARASRALFARFSSGSDRIRASQPHAPPPTERLR